jgi:O-methyltransferase
MNLRPSIPSLFIGITGEQTELEELQLLLRRLTQLLQNLDIWSTDNLITFGRNLSFLDDERLINIIFKNANHEYDKAIVWRSHVVTWAAKNALNIDGEFVECGTHLGFTASVINDYVELEKNGRELWCYDLFDGEAYDKLKSEGIEPISWITNKFQNSSNIKIIKGRVPESIIKHKPEKVAFLHLDLNSATAEIGALEQLVPLMPKGAMVVLDDYGWKNYKPQKHVADEFFAERGTLIMEIPTGQGLVVIR